MAYVGTPEPTCDKYFQDYTFQETFRTTATMDHNLTIAADALGLSKSRLLRIVISDWLEKHFYDLKTWAEEYNARRLF